MAGRWLTRRWLGWLVVAVPAAAIVLLVDEVPNDPWNLERRPEGVMGTTCRLVVVGRQRTQMKQIDKAFESAESALRGIEALMSTWLEDSEVSRFNRMAGGGSMRMSARTLEVLEAARRLYEQSGGAFDVTAGPLFDLWKGEARAGRLPTAEQIREARGDSDWQGLAMDRGRSLLLKYRATVAVELSGLAKGYAVDRAVEAMRAAGVSGGLVDVGGDLRCFGRQADGSPWRVKVKDPFGEGTVMGLVLERGGAVCTSGNYARYYEIGGRRYSHIIDPRTGRPAEAAPSVTVIAPDCMTADGWATALSVLGPEGLERIEGLAGVEAMVITGDARRRRMHFSSGFRQYVGREGQAGTAGEAQRGR